MPTVANLAVSVTARTSQFHGAMTRAAGTLRAFSDDVSRMTTRLVGFGVVAGGVAVGGLVLMTKKAFTLANTAADLAKKLGLTVEQMVGLQFAASVSGIKAAKFNRILEGMAVRLTKTGKASISLSKLLKGINVGGGDLGLMVKVTKSLGISLSALGAQQIQDATKAIRRLIAVVRATSFEMAIRLAPHIKRVAEALLRFAVMARLAVMDGKLFELVMKGLAIVAEQLSRILAFAFGTRIQRLIVSAANRFVDFGEAGKSSASVVTAAFGIMAEAGAKLANALKLLEAGWHGLNIVVLRVSDTMLRAFEKLLGGVRLFLTEFLSAIRAVATLLPIPPETIRKADEAIRAFQKNVDTTRLAMADLVGGFAQDIADATDKMNKALTDFASGKAGDDVRLFFVELGERLKDLRLRAKDIVEELLGIQEIRIGIPRRAARTAEFQQISLRRTAISGVNAVNRPQLIVSPQIATTNDILTRIRATLAVARFGLTS